MRFLALIAAALTAAASPALAQDLLAAASPLDAARRLPLAGGDPARVEPAPDAARLPDLPDLPDLGLRLPRFSWAAPRPAGDLVDQVTLTRLPPGSLVVRYEGLQGLVVRRLQRELRVRWQRSLRDAWDAGVLDDDAYEGALEEMYDELTDVAAGGRWWTRSWRDSLPEAKGGAPARPYVHIVGQRVEVLRLGWLSLTSDGRARVDGLTVLRLDPSAGPYVRRGDGPVAVRLAREHARLARDPSGDAEDAGAGREDATDVAPPTESPSAIDAAAVRLVFQPPSPTRWVGASEVRFRLRPTVRFGVGQVETYFVRDVALRGSVTWYAGLRRTPVASFEAVVRYETEDGTVSAGVELALLAW